MEVNTQNLIITFTNLSWVRSTLNSGNAKKQKGYPLKRESMTFYMYLLSISD